MLMTTSTVWLALSDCSTIESPSESPRTAESDRGVWLRSLISSFFELATCDVTIVAVTSVTCT